MKITVELIAIELPQFGDDKSRDIELADGASVSEALSVLKAESSQSLLTMVNGEAVPRDEWQDVRLKENDTLSLFRPFKGG